MGVQSATAVLHAPLHVSGAETYSDKHLSEKTQLWVQRAVSNLHVGLLPECAWKTNAGLGGFLRIGCIALLEHRPQHHGRADGRVGAPPCRSSGLHTIRRVLQDAAVCAGPATRATYSSSPSQAHDTTSTDLSSFADVSPPLTGGPSLAPMPRGQRDSVGGPTGRVSRLWGKLLGVAKQD